MKSRTKSQSHEEEDLAQLSSRFSIRITALLVAMGVGLASLCAETPALPLDPGAVIAAPTFNATKGVWSYAVTSPFQTGSNVIEVLLPATYTPTKRYQVVYVLPVEPGTGTTWGDGLQVVKATGYHNDYDVICVQPTFAAFPWYGDHATVATKRQESYMNKVVVPLIEQNYSTRREPAGRLLMGFSKSGWGAFALLMRNPGIYGYAASWDSPMLLDFGQYATGDLFADQANFDQYSPEALVATPAPSLFTGRRLILSGENLFGSEPNGLFAATPHTMTYHSRLSAAGIPHQYFQNIASNHSWLSAGWVAPIFESLVALSRPGTGSETTLLASNFEGIPSPSTLTARKLTDAAGAGQWVIGDLRTSGLRTTSGDTAVMMQGQGRPYNFRSILASPFVIGRTGTFSFDVAVRNGFGTATSGHGRDRDNFVVGMDELGNEVFRLAVMGWGTEGRLAYHSANGTETWLGSATNNILRNNTDVYDPAKMRSVRVDLKPGGMDIWLAGVKLASDVPYNSTGKRICEISYRGETVNASVYYNNFLLTSESGLQAWQRQYWPGITDQSQIGPLANPPGDGIANLLKYATGANPLEVAKIPATEPGWAGGVLSLRFLREGNALDVTYIVEASSDLSDWSEIWSDRNPSLGGDGILRPQEVMDSAAPSSGRRFMRLRVTRP